MEREHARPYPTLSSPGAEWNQVTLEQRDRELNALYRISDLMLQPQPLADCLQAIAAEISQASEFPIVAIELYDAARQVMVFIGTQGIPQPSAPEPLTVPLANTISGRVLQTRQPLIHQYSPQDTKLCDADATLGQLGLRTFLCFPMATAQRPIGTLSLADRSLRTVDETTQRWLSSLANYLAGMIDQKQTEIVLRNLADGVSAETGEAFFQALVRYLADLLGTQFGLITAVVGERRDRATTLAVCAGGTIHPNFGYSLQGTPCEQVVGGKTCVYPCQVQDYFPEDHLLIEMGIESYLGIPLTNRSGVCLGLLAVMDTKPLENIAYSESMLKIFAMRAAAELERKWAEDSLARQAEELAASNAELEQFAYIASHDLQEPLRMVTSYLQLLARRYRGQLGADADDFIAYAVDGVDRMKTLITDLLNYSRIGTRQREFELTNCEDVWQRSLANLKVAIGETRASLTHDPLPIVMADSAQLVQLVQNLVSNALKFRGTEPPHIHLAVQETEQDWIFSLQDNGIGIDPAYQDRIFVLFQRLHTREAYPGTGIGLAICKKIVERHHGKIWLESAPGQGSIFHFSIPK